MRSNRLVLMDIEGTLSPTAFVHDVMFPYAAERLAEFIRSTKDHQATQEDLAAVAATLAEEAGGSSDTETQIGALLGWIQQDRKHPALKSLQGRIWRDGFENGQLVAPLYDDVLPAWQRWQQQGLRLGIYSSGSITAQKLFFSHTKGGDVLSQLSCFFDLTTGSKKEACSYRKILAEQGLEGEQVVFLSDVPAELVAADQAGIRGVHVVRPGTAEHSDWQAWPDLQQFQPFGPA